MRSVRQNPGVTIHPSDPFATPEQDRSPVRRFRGRLPSAVTLWTARDGDGRPAGLTVSSTVVVDGDPGRVLGVLDEESALWEAVRATGVFTVAPLPAAERQLADAFAEAAGIRDPDGPVDPRTGVGRGGRVLFQKVPEPKTVKNRVHLDLHVGADARAEAVDRLKGFGATVLWEGSQGPNSWVTMADPELNEFCVA